MISHWTRGLATRDNSVTYDSSTMAENKMNDAVTKMMDNLDRSVLRDLQVRLVLCARCRKCFDRRRVHGLRIDTLH